MTRRKLNGQVHAHSRNIQDYAWTTPTGPALTRWRLVNWWRCQPHLDPAHLPPDIKAALALLGAYVRQLEEP